MLFLILGPSSLSVVVAQPDERHTEEQLLCWSGMTDQEHTATFGSNKEERPHACLEYGTIRGEMSVGQISFYLTSKTRFFISVKFCYVFFAHFNKIKSKISFKFSNLLLRKNLISFCSVSYLKINCSPRLC